MTKERTSVGSEPRVFVFDDGRHAGSLYQFEPTLSREDLIYNVDQLVGSGVDTLVYFVGLEGGVVLYDSRVAPQWGDNVVEWTHPVWYRASRNIKRLIADGHDPLKLLCDRSHEKGIWFIASNWVALDGGDRETSGGLGRKTDFVYDHPQFQVGEEDDPRAQHVSPARFSFLHPEVRDQRFMVFQELLTRYETDGIELDLVDFVPLCRFDEVDRLAPVLTRWLRDLRRVASEAQQAQGRRKRIYVRIPSHPDAWKALGYDIATWVSESIVDGLICMAGLAQSPADQHPDLSGAVAVARGTACRVFFAFRTSVGRQLHQWATPPMIWAAAANAYAQGADGFGLGDACWTPNGWPWTSQEYETLRLLGHPDMLATADKLYRARSRVISDSGVSTPGGASTDWAPGVSDALPRTLSEGEPVQVALRISDDLERWNALGRVESVRLRVRLTGIEPSLNEVRVELNGRPLPDSNLHLNDLGYRLWRMGAVGPYGYIYDYHLTPEHYPRMGRNEVTTTLVKRDKGISTSFDLFDVDCVIRYRLHRHFRRVPIDY